MAYLTPEISGCPDINLQTCHVGENENVPVSAALVDHFCSEKTVLEAYMATFQFRFVLYYIIIQSL